MNVLSVENITKTFGVRTIFKDVTFGLDQGDKMAIVAKNGSGKSTLLRCLNDIEPIDSGRIVYRNDLSIAYMEQAENLDGKKTVLEAVLGGDMPEMVAIRNYTLSLRNGDQELMNDSMQALTDLNAWDIEAKIEQILSILRLDDTTKKVSMLSGGQQKRVALAKVLVSEADILILDEPTNHLDLDMIEWLEEYLSKSKSTILMVTHDRYFLEVVCDVILELEDETLYKYKGNFSYYLEKKAERQEQLASTVGKARNTFKKELEWIRRQPKARGVKQKARVEAFDGIKETASTRLDEDEMDIPVKMERLGSKIVEFHKVFKSWPGLKILDNFSYHFQRKERLGIVGKNGTGKSTFLQMITDKIPVDSGKITVGETVHFGYYSQDLIETADDKKVIDVIRDIAEYIPLEKGKQLSAAQLLEKFLFPRHMHYQFVYKLSGGEKRRLKLLTVLMSNPNFLILDEPTNDLDIFVMAVLEDYLRQFEGCLIVVSHDRYFMDKMVDHLFVFEGEGVIKDITGNYTAFREVDSKGPSRPAETKVLEVKAPETPTPSKSQDSEEKKKLSFKEKLEYDGLEKELEDLETKKDEFTAVLSSGDASNEELTKAGMELKKIVDAIEAKTDRWLELADRI
jgi:ATP-binding cassette subfamily F protein uup|tara:strand:- start:12209 stop:14086 length:1878 start_codon:yes stop_codon:yes gene_type:complete